MRRILVTCSVCLFVATSLFPAIARCESRPNILFIYADDQNYKTLSCVPESPSWVQTPNIDAMARHGLRFDRAYFGAWCMPSRASFLTGRLQHGIESMRMVGQYPGSQYDPQQCPFWPSVLRTSGYHTAQIGKWHTGTDTGFGRDWDHQMVWCRPAHPENAGNYFYDQIVTIDGQDKQVPGYSTDNYTDWAVDYVSGKHRDPDKPWFLWLCYGAVHGPTTPADRHLKSYTDKKAAVPADIFGPWPDKPAYLNTIRSWEESPEGHPVRRRRKVAASNFNTNTAGQSLDNWVQQVNQCAIAIDEGVGRLMATLRKTGQLDNTLVIYTADQGFALGEHGMNNKVAPYDAALASPLIFYFPKSVPAGKVCKHPVNAPDVVQWLCQFAQIEIPWQMHGRDIRPLFEQPETQSWDQPMLMTHTGRKYGSDASAKPSEAALYEVGGIPWYVLMRDGDYKYVRYLVEDEWEELYDLANDPEELTNLAVNPEHSKHLKQLRAKAIAELRKTDARFADHMPRTRTAK